VHVVHAVRRQTVDVHVGRPLGRRPHVHGAARRMDPHVRLAQGGQVVDVDVGRPHERRPLHHGVWAGGAEVRVRRRLTYVAKSACWGHGSYYTEIDTDLSPTLKLRKRLWIYFLVVSNSSRRFLDQEDSSWPSLAGRSSP